MSETPQVGDRRAESRLVATARQRRDQHPVAVRDGGRDRPTDVHSEVRRGIVLRGQGVGGGSRIAARASVFSVKCVVFL
jgi:hypothetical protein